MSGPPSLPDIHDEDLHDPVQFRIKYEMDPFRFEIRRTDLSAGLYTALISAAGSLMLDAQTYGLDRSLAAFPFQEAGKAFESAQTAFYDSLAPGLRGVFSTEQGAAGHAGAAREAQRQAVISAMPRQAPPSPSLEQRAVDCSGVTALFAFGAVALLSGGRYASQLRKKRFKAAKSKVEALEAAYAGGTDRNAES